MTDYKNLKLIATSSPHIRGSETTQGIMKDVIIAMLPALAFACFNFGVRALTVTVVSVAGCMFWEWLYRKLLKKPQSVMDLSSVVTGMLLAFVCAGGAALMWRYAQTAGMTEGSAAHFLLRMFVVGTLSNFALAWINLVPIPPLDGSRILAAVLPDRIYYKIMQYEQIIMIALFALIFFGFLNGPLSLLTGYVWDGLNAVAALPFNLLKGLR